MAVVWIMVASVHCHGEGKVRLEGDELQLLDITFAATLITLQMILT